MGNCCSSIGGQGDEGNSHALQNYDPVRYVPDIEMIRSTEQIVTRVHFVAYTILENGGNHWTMYLETGRRSSVRINMEPSELRGAQVSGHGYRGVMEVRDCNHAVTRDHHTLVSIPALAGHPVAHFIDAIINANNHEYDFTTGGRGCTGWMLDQWELFTQMSLIRPEFTAIKDIINKGWVEGVPIETRLVTRGFYVKNTRGGGWSKTIGGSQRSRRTQSIKTNRVLGESITSHGS